MTDYASIDAVNWSTLKAIRTSPKHYRHLLRVKREETPALRMGIAIHTAVLEPERFEELHPVFTLGKTRRSQSWRDFEGQHPGKVILLEDEAVNALAAARAVMEHPIAARLMSTPFREQVATWTDPETGIDCKCRVDVFAAGLRELKSTRGIEPRRFATQAAQLGYHGQLAFYHDGLIESGVALLEEPRIVAVESSPPFDVVVYRVGHEALSAGRSLYQSLLRTLAECRESDEWPGVAADEVDLHLPAWAHTEVEEALTMIVDGVSIAV